MTLAGYIKSDLRARLRSGKRLPVDLTLESLAGHYDVSFTPVRTAVAELVAEGLLHRGPDRRLIPVVVDHTQNEANEEVDEDLPFPPRDLQEVVGDELVRQSLKGEAVYLREEAAAKQFGVSRSAMRNVFHHLAGIGLLTHIPRRGWQVRPFRQEDMHAFLEVREVLELKALDAAWNRIIDEDLQKFLKANLVPTTKRQWPKIDHSLHGYIIDKSQNPYIKDFFVRHGRYFEILFDWEDDDRETAVETALRHRQILEAMLRRDRETAREALTRDIRCGHPKLSRLACGAPLNVE